MVWLESPDAALSLPWYAECDTSLESISSSDGHEIFKVLRGLRLNFGMLALYNLIGVNQKEDQPMNIGAVKEMLDTAMAKSQGGLLKFNKKKRVDRDGFTVLYEKDFAK